MPHRKLPVQLLLVALPLILLLGMVGCGEDATAPRFGEVIIEVFPDSLPIPWTLVSGKAMYSGVGDTTLSSLSPGDYELTWGGLLGYVLPNPPRETETVAAGEAIVFHTVYTEFTLGDFVAINAGSFTMGAPPGDSVAFADERPPHPVTISRPFWLKSTEVTQAEYGAIMCENPSYWQGCDDCPVERVNWNSALLFCNTLSDWAGLAPAYTITPDTVVWDRNAPGYRLASEAEWEYACRAGSSSRFYAGDHDSILAGIGWYAGNARGFPHRVGEKSPNDWGLYDMHGNVFELCWDWFASYDDGGVTDPAGPATGLFRISRGGGYQFDPDRCTATARGLSSPSETSQQRGLRIARNDQPKHHPREEQ
ncbi:MAG: formylglycine-generating enzyme family protein [bacterium]